MNEQSQPKLLAGGNLDERPIDHILLYVFEKKLSGSLRLDFDDKTKLGIYLHQGRPAVASWSPRRFSLEEILVDLDIVDSEEISLVRQGQNAQADVIEIFCQKGIVDDAAYAQAVREQIRRSIQAAFEHETGRYAFYENINLITDAEVSRGFPTDVLPILTAGIRSRGPGAVGSALLAKLSGRTVRLTDSSVLAHLDLDASERRASKRLLGTEQEFDQLLEKSPKERAALERIVYLTLLLRALEVSRPPEANACTEPVTAESNTAPLEEPAAVKPLLTRLEELEETVGRRDCFEMLGIEPGATPEEARAAFMTLAKELHPDRVGKKLDEGDRKRLANVFAALTDAHATLTSPQKRAEYLDGLDKPSSEERDEEQTKVRDALEAESSYQKALVFLRRSETPKAVEMLNRSLELAPGEPEYLACWAHAQALQRGPKASVDDLLAKLRAAAEQVPKSVRVQGYLAQMLKRADRLNEAAAQFEKVLEQSPSNIEAARELRLIKMRLKRDAEKPKGFFEKLFK